MSSVMAPRSKPPISRIPVLVKNEKPSNMNDLKTKDLKKPVFKVSLASSTKVTRSSHIQKQSTAQLVRSVKAQNNKSVQSVKLGQNGQLSLKNNEGRCNIVKKDNKSSQLKNATEFDSNKQKNINKPSNSKEKTLKTKDTVKSNIINKDNNKVKVSSLKTNAQTKKNETEFAIDCSNSPKFTPLKCEPEKENKVFLRPNWFSAQKDMFEINENNRKMILRDHPPSPVIGNKISGFRMSSMQSQRPSLYQPMEMVTDPYKEAMRAIGKTSLSFKSEQKKKPEKPLQLLSPFKDRNSFYTPCADPKQEVMESLRKLKLKQQQQLLQKSTKKVTFNLNVIECTPKNVCDTEPKLIQESKLSQIYEKSEENTPNCPDIEKPSADQDKADKLLVDFKKTDKLSPGNKENKVAEIQNKYVKGFYTSQEKSIASAVNSIIPEALCPEIKCKNITSPSSKKIDCLPLSINNFSGKASFANKMCTKYERTTIQKVLDPTSYNKENIKFSNQSMVFTPRPISFSSQSKLKDSCSPEFLVKGASEMLLKEAPICTPLVWKSVAKNTQLSPDMETTLSPVRLKLDFTEKETPMKENPSLNCKQIKTIQGKLDELADQECCIWLSSESIPVICGRYITNPVAETLTKGDEIHFIPIKL